MSKIKLLDEDLINKIAAGEVIERPASVVKELIENSLDAGATRINIEIKDSGKKLIKISDNGFGMGSEDARKSILRHATSKISNVNDLFAIQTLGFRGEALASIAAISKLSIITKQKDDVEAFNLVIEGGKEISSGALGAETGTTIEVQDIFFNTPARKKFLKTDAVELKHIIDVVLRYSLINENVSFKLKHEKHELLNSPIVENLRDNVASIYGINLVKDLLEINYDDDLIKINGFIAKPSQARNDKNLQHIFVNNRWIRNENITKAVYDGYHSLLFVGKHPICILNLVINPQKIDVNVHPAKTQIKIEQKKEIYDSVLKAIKETLEKHNLIPVMDVEIEEQLTFGNSNEKINQKNKDKNVKYNFEPSEQKMLDISDVEPSVNGNHSEEKINNINNNEKENFIFKPNEKNVIEQSLKLPAMKILGQVHKTFFVAETEGGLLLIDQHVVQERVLYEKFMKQLMNKKIAIQKLLSGGIIEVYPPEKILIESNLDKLNEFGFKLEEFGDNTFILKTIPSIFGRVQPQELLYSVLDKLQEGKNRLEEIQEEIITRMACRASVKAGDTMTIPEIQKLLEELSKCKLPYTCPHGRSVLIKVPVDELEKKFKRK